eukprot:156301_1
MLTFRRVQFQCRSSRKRVTHNIRSFTKKKIETPSTTRASKSLLHRDTSVLTQGSVLSQRDPSKLRTFNQQTDELNEYQDELLPDMPFKYDDESLIITPTIRNHTQPVPRSMHYNNDPQSHSEEVVYPELQYFNVRNVKQYEEPSYSEANQPQNRNAKRTANQMNVHNVNVRLQRLFYSDKATPQPSDHTIDTLLASEIEIDAEDMMMQSVSQAEQKHKQLEFDALQLEEDELSHTTGVGTPDFKQLYPDDEEREIEIDKYLRKSPDIDEKRVAPPPDAIILPVYGEIKEYAKMLHCERNVIAATLRHLGIYTHNIITQEAGQRLVQHLRPNTEVIIEQLVDELVPRLPYRANDKAKLSKRKPVLCILGHVDHGKTTLLDYLRHSHVAEHEAGGITQSIGAFTIDMRNTNINCHYDEITVFDTPGHAAFTGMRQRGAHVVDLAILVIDTCDGIKPQTKESLAIIRKEKIPFVVALNKMDRVEAEPEKIKSELQELGVNANEVEMIRISAKTGEGITSLLETVDIICELEEPCGNHDMDCNAELVVIEAKKSAAQGTVIHALVQDGVLKNGDTLLKLHGFDRDSHAKISRLQNENGVNIDCAMPSTPVSFLGFHKALPEVGTILIAAHNDKHAFDLIQMRETHEYYRNKLKIHARVSSSHPKLHDPTAALAGNSSHSSMEDVEEDELNIEAKWSSTPNTDNPRQLNIWIRADTWGSIEAIENYLYQIRVPNEEYYFEIISKDIGPLYENIIKQCDSRNCYILNFNVPIKRSSYKSKHVAVFDSNIIFDLFNKFIETLEDKLAPIEQHVLCGRAWVKEVFEVKDKERTSYVAGCIVESGKIKYDAHFRVKRNGNIIYEQWGVTELKHFAVNVDEIECGDECGMKLEFEDWQPEDLIECLDIIQEKNKIEAPIFDLDPSLQHSLYSGTGGDAMHQAMDTVFAYSGEDYEDENEFIGTHKNTSDAPRVRATKDKKGRRVFESV